ncbi:hypothetical protein FKB34_01000 [Glycocaulis profundi]|nr:hypothetical protein FKB34_01000 [Glycocaulis profundi]
MFRILALASLCLTGLAACASTDRPPGLNAQECGIAAQVLRPIMRAQIEQGGRVILADRMALIAEPDTDADAWWPRVRSGGFPPQNRSADMDRALLSEQIREAMTLRQERPDLPVSEREAMAWDRAHAVHGDDRAIPADDLWASFMGRNARAAPLRCRTELARVADFEIADRSRPFPEDAIVITLSRAGFSEDGRRALIHAEIARHPQTEPGPLHRSATFWMLDGGWPVWRTAGARALWFAEDD